MIIRSVGSKANKKATSRQGDCKKTGTHVMIRVPKSAAEYENVDPGHVMNIRDGGICSLCARAATLDGSKAL